MAQAIETAFIEVVGDLSDFNEELDEGVKKALNQAAEAAERVFQNIEMVAGDAASAIAESFGDVSDAVRRANPDLFGNVEQSARNAAQTIAQEFRSLRDEVAGAEDPAQRLAVGIDELRNNVRRLGGEDALDALESEFRQLELAVIRLDNRMEDALTDSLNRIGDAGDRVGTRLRQSLGRTAVGGVEQLDASIQDFTTETENEFDILRDQIEATFTGLANTPGLQRLEGEIKELADTLETELEDAGAQALSRLDREFRDGTISAERFRIEVAQLANQMTDGLGDAVDKVQSELRLLRGDDEIFRDMTASINSAQQEALDLDQALERLNDFRPELARLFRQSEPAIEDVTRAIQQAESEVTDLHGEALRLDTALERLDDINIDLADEFRRAGPTLERVQEAIDQIGDETRQTAGALQLAGRSARNFGNNFRFGRIVAGFNRVRFLMLDLRFVLGGIGAFAAAQFARFGLEAASAVEQARLSFQVIGRSIEGDLNDSILRFRDVATESLDEVIQFARETPFSLEQVTNAVRRISAFLPSLGVASDEALSTLAGRTEVSIDLFEDLGAALSVLGNQDAIDRLVKGLGDVGAAGRLTGEDARQLRNALPGIEIRSAIISGILDPTVESSDAIETLREEFGSLGATAEAVPQAALQRFVDLQRQGLIPAEAVVKGLRQSLVNLAGEDAIEAFTFTIEGVIEKVREAAEVGSAVGFEPLAASLAETVLPQLERVEDGAERFASGLTELFQEIVPIGLDLFGGMTEVGAQAFEGLADIIDRNQGTINQILSEAGDLVSNFVDALLDVAEAAIPLGPPLIEIADTLIEGFVPILEFVIPLLADMAEVLSTLDFGELLTLASIVKFRAGVVNALAAMTQNMDNLAAKALNASVRFGALGIAIGLVVGGALRRRYESFFEEGVEGAEDLADSLVDTDSGLADLTDSLQPAADELRDYAAAQFEMADAAREGNQALSILFDGISFLSGADFLQFFGFEGFQRQIDDLELGVQSLLNPDIGRGLAGSQTALTEADRIEDMGQRVDAAFEQVRLRLLRTNTTFDDTALRAALAGDGLANLAEEAGISERELQELAEEGVNPVIEALLNGIGGPEAMEEAFRNLGIEVLQVSFDEAIGDVELLESAFEGATGKIKELSEALRAQSDPIFALQDAQQNLEDAQAALADPPDDATPQAIEDLETAVIDAAREVGFARDAVAGMLGAEGIDTNIADIIEAEFDRLRGILPPDVSDEFIRRMLPSVEEVEDQVAGTFGALEGTEFEIGTGSVETLLDVGVEAFNEMRNTGRNAFNALGEDFDRSAGAMSRTAEQAADRIGGEFNDLGPTIGASGERVETTMDRSIRNVSDQFVEAVNEMEREGGFEWVANNFETAVGPIPRHFDAAGQEAINALEAVLPGNVGRIGDEAAVEFRFGIGDIPTHARLTGEDAYTDFLVATRPMGDQGEVLQGVFVLGFEPIRGRVRGIGANLPIDLADGISSAVDAAASAASSMANEVVIATERGFLIGSPSKKMLDIGGFAVEGLIDGITNQLPRVATAGQAITDTLQSSVNPALDVGIAQAERSPINVNGSPARLANQTAPSGINVNIDKVESPRPEQAGQRVATAITDTLYLNTGRLLQ